MVFLKSKKLDNVHHVAVNDVIVGNVKKVERWTVRGKSFEWEARCAGKYFGSFRSRKEAGEFLANRK